MKKITRAEPESRSDDGAEVNVEALRATFPSAFTEGEVDFDILRQLLGDAVDEKPEKYGLNWPGKRAARQLALTPSAGTLRPNVDASSEWETTHNLMIEGDNLEVLKLLQKSYAGRVKLIYIDPPYNTGGDFVYPDDFRDGVANYLRVTGQAGEGDVKLTSNPEASGRFHADWLSMILPRLMLARTMLRRDGAIVVSIDDNELPRLLSVLEEVFGEENVVNVVAVKSSEASGVKMSHVTRRLPKLKEYLVVVARNRESLELVPVKVTKVVDEDDDAYLKYYNKVILNPDATPTEWTIVGVKEHLESLGREPTAEAARAFKLENADRVVYRTNNKLLASQTFDTSVAEVVSPTGIKYIWWEGKQMLFLSDHLETGLGDLWTDISTINLNKETFGVRGFGAGQKPIGLLTRIIKLLCPPEEPAIVVDFFAGSGSTAHAVLQANVDDGGRRSFVMVQLQEPLDPSTPEQQEAVDFCDGLDLPRSVSELTKERIRRAGASYSDSVRDSGFRAFKLDSSNISAWDPDDHHLEGALLDSLEHIKEGRTETDILFELVLKLGLELTVSVETREVDGVVIHSVGAGTLMACLADKLNESDVESVGLGIAGWHRELDPVGETTVVFRDDAFANDVAKTNMTAILEQHGLATVRSL